MRMLTVPVRLWSLLPLKLVLLVALSMLASTTQGQPQATATPPIPDKPRVYVADSESWEMIGGWGMSGSRNANGSGSFGGSGYSAGGARPQTAEIIKTFNQRCPNVTVTNDVQKADFAVILDHEGGKGLVHRRNKIAVFNRDGDAVFSDSTRELGNSVKDACQAILSAPPRPRQTVSPVSSANSPAAQSASYVKSGNPSPSNSDGSVEIASTPSGADIELDGNFIGNTPSAVGVSPGDHTISVKKSGFKIWERKIRVTSGHVSVSAELEPEVKQPAPAAATTPEPEESEQKTNAVAVQTPVVPVTAAPKTASAETPQKLGAVTFASDPPGADVYVDNSPVGKAPVTLNPKPGQHNVRMAMAGYKNWSQEIMVVRGSELKVGAKLEKAE